MSKKVKYFVSYYYRKSFFKKGFGWAELMYDKTINSSNDIFIIRDLIKKEYGFKRVSIINFFVFDEPYQVDGEPFYKTNDSA